MKNTKKEEKLNTMELKRILSTLIIVLSIMPLFSQENNQFDSVLVPTEKQDDTRQHFVGSSIFVLGNFLPDPPEYIQLNYGYQFTPRDAIIFEFITWNYDAPLGIPYGQSWEDEDKDFPGYVKDYGIGVGYQRFHWKGLYTTIQATPFLQQYFTPEKEKIQNGFQLWLQLRLGYRVEFFNHRFFIEPSFVCNYWPVNTNLPESFQILEDEWPNYFLGEPGLHFGFKF